MSRPEKPLLLRVFGYVEPGTTAAATNGPSERFFFQSGGGTPLFPSRSHRFGTGGSRTLFGSFRLFDIHTPLKTMDIWRRKITLCGWSPNADCRRRPAELVKHSEPRRITSNSYQRRYRTRSRRLRAPLPSCEDRSVFGARASPDLREGCPDEERSRRSPSRLPPSTPVRLGPVGATPGPGRNVGGAPRVQNPAQCCQYAPLPDLAACGNGIMGMHGGPIRMLGPRLAEP